MAERHFQILSNRIASMNGLVVPAEGKLRLQRKPRPPVDLSRVPMPRPVIAHPADRGGGIDFPPPPDGAVHPPSRASGALFGSRSHDMSPSEQLHRKKIVTSSFRLVISGS